MPNTPAITWIVGDTRWDPGDVHEQMHASMIPCFEVCAEGTEALGGGEGQDKYRMTVENAFQFSLVVDYLPVGHRCH